MRKKPTSRNTPPHIHGRDLGPAARGGGFVGVTLLLLFGGGGFCLSFVSNL